MFLGPHPNSQTQKRQKKKKIHWHFQVLACFFNRSKALKAELRQLVFSMAWDSGFEGSQPWAFSAAARPQPLPCEGSTRPQPWASSRMQDTRPQPWACIACVLAEAPGRSHGRWPGRSRGQSQLPGRSRGVRRESMHARPQPHNIYIYIISLGKGLYGSQGFSPVRPFREPVPWPPQAPSEPKQPRRPRLTQMHAKTGIWCHA